MKHLVLGGARSGKSQFAERLALSVEKRCFYMASGWPGDDEMAKRIALHQQQRNKHWQLVEEPLALADTLKKIDGVGHVILIDCLTLWLSNALHREVWAEQREAFLDVLPHLRSDLYIVSNEVGSGIVPLGELSRTFADQAGWLNQAVAHLCDNVTLIVAGLPLTLKSFPPAEQFGEAKSL